MLATMIVPAVWSMVQDSLRTTIADAARLYDRDTAPGAIEQLFLGLVMTGLAIQATGFSRPASGSEHQFSHFWEMQGLSHRGQPVSHGFKVAVGTLASTRLYEELLGHDLGLGSEHAFRVIADTWPSLAAQEAEVRRLQPTTNMVERALEEIRAKYVTRDEMIPRLRTIANCWPVLGARLRDQLIPSEHLRRLLHSAGCPTTPEQIGPTGDGLRMSHLAARQIRRRYTVLDLAAETGRLHAAIDVLFSPHGAWSSASTPTPASSSRLPFGRTTPE